MNPDFFVDPKGTAFPVPPNATVRHGGFFIAVTTPGKPFENGVQRWIRTGRNTHLVFMPPYEPDETLLIPCGHGREVVGE